jgi:hypothetical protein
MLTEHSLSLLTQFIYILYLLPSGKDIHPQENLIACREAKLNKKYKRERHETRN